MTSLIAKPYTKLDQESIDEKVVDIVEENAELEAGVESSSSTLAGDSSGTQKQGVDWEKRYRDLQSYSDKQLNTLRQDLETSQQSKVSLSSPEEIADFMERNPDQYRMMQTIAREAGASVAAPLSSKLDDIETDTNQAKAIKAKTQIIKAHPDFDQVVNSDEFHEWAQAQTQEVQRWVYDNPNDADLAITALDLYKVKTGVKNDTKSKKTSESAADAVGTGGSPDVSGGKKIWKASTIKSLHPKKYEKLENEIDLAFNEGRVDFNS
jgi:hypothetical protein|tara:strand:- start:983 stop:1780 length:798 start_codon:yes stop_codon:yes gene_type:complete